MAWPWQRCAQQTGTHYGLCSLVLANPTLAEGGIAWGRGFRRDTNDGSGGGKGKSSPLRSRHFMREMILSEEMFGDWPTDGREGHCGSGSCRRTRALACTAGGSARSHSRSHFVMVRAGSP